MLVSRGARAAAFRAGRLRRGGVARLAYVLGVGIAHAVVRNFAYLAGMGLETVVATPKDGSLPIDDLVRAGPGDVPLAVTFRPYRPRPSYPQNFNNILRLRFRGNAAKKAAVRCPRLDGLDLPGRRLHAPQLGEPMSIRETNRGHDTALGEDTARLGIGPRRDTLQA